MLRKLAAPASFLVIVALLFAAAAAQPPSPPSGTPTPQPPPTSSAQPPPSAPGQPPSTGSARDQPSEEGIPIPDARVIKTCGPCHQPDAKGNLSRISFQRNTPEGWQSTVRRMVSLNNVQIDPATARDVVRYLSNNLGLAPEELKPGAFEVERRLIDYKYTDRDTETVCSKCHSMGRVILQRRTKEEWQLLVNMHRGWYPLSDFQAFRRTGPPQREPGSDGRPPDNRHPVEKALDHLTRTFPLHTPEWTAWSANVRQPRLDGVWVLTGSEPGRGPIVGRVRIAANPAAADEFTTDISYTYVRNGRTITRAGRTIVYTGFQWRGRSTEGGDDKTSLREVMAIDRDWQGISGRWFAGGYDEIGFDVQMRRLGSGPSVLAIDRPSLRTSTTQDVRVFGANLPSSPTPADVDFGRGVKVSRIVSATPDVLTVTLDVAADAAVGPRDVFVAGAHRAAATTVYDRIDWIKVMPQANMARVGGIAFPKMQAQFEAFAYHNGPDGKQDTKDDVNLGPIDAKWSLEEYSATFGDEDIKYVGTIDASSGLFTPADDGPNPQRSGNANNVGDVWVIATVAAPPAGNNAARQLRARAHLLVTVPLYVRWDLTVAPK
jgi:quinohemoprotein amine dehydrogenase